MLDFTPQSRASLKKLMGFCEEERQALRQDLADVSKARAAAEASLHALPRDAEPKQQRRHHARGMCLQQMLEMLEDAQAHAQWKYDSAAEAVDELARLVKINEKFIACGAPEPRPRGISNNAQRAAGLRRFA